MEIQKIVLEKHLKDLWKNKIVRYVRFYFVMITIEKFSRQAQNVVACFLLQEKRLLMAEPKTIYCPKCGRKVATWDGRSKNNVSAKCSKCRKLVVYDTEIKEVKLIEVPPRIASSGMRFY